MNVPNPDDGYAHCCDVDGSCTDGDDDYCCGVEFYCSNDGTEYAEENGGILCPSNCFFVNCAQSNVVKTFFFGHIWELFCSH